MIDLKRLEKDSDQQGSYYQKYRSDLEARGGDLASLDQLMELAGQRKKLILESETAKSNQNKVSGEIARMKKAGEDASGIIAEMQGLSKKVKELEAQRDEVDQKVEGLLLRIPNHVHESTPVGKDESENQVVREWGDKKNFDFDPKEHDDLGVALGLMDFERAGKVSGARFVYLMGAVARMERALINFMLDLHTGEHGYQEILPPFIVNSASMQGTGQFPKFVEDAFHLEGTDQHLIPTAEVPVTNIYRDEILAEEELTKAFVAYSPCFRAEAGSHGRDTKGLIRQHQFNKVELMKFTLPEASYEEHEKLRRDAETVLEKLGLPYRTVALCTGDIGFGAAKCYDIEVWLPSQKAYREISSCSNFEDFQARRANIRYRPSALKAKPQYLHTLNGSGLAVGRTLLAVLENYQHEDGSIKIPEALQPYMGGMKEIRR